MHFIIHGRPKFYEQPPALESALLFAEFTGLSLGYIIPDVLIAKIKPAPLCPGKTGLRWEYLLVKKITP